MQKRQFGGPGIRSPLIFLIQTVSGQNRDSARQRLGQGRFVLGGGQDQSGVGIFDNREDSLRRPATGLGVGCRHGHGPGGKDAKKRHRKFRALRMLQQDPLSGQPARPQTRCNLRRLPIKFAVAKGCHGCAVMIQIDKSRAFRVGQCPRAQQLGQGGKRARIGVAGTLRLPHSPRRLRGNLMNNKAWIGVSDAHTENLYQY